MRRPARNLAGALSLNALAALLARAALVVSNDTGPLHLARAVGAQTIGIYWMGNAITGGPVLASGNRCCVAWQTHCPRCGKDCVTGDAHIANEDCDHAVSFVGSVAADEVLAHAWMLLGRETGLRLEANSL
jgi:ADP-heptose:LPS heptosyltransferase